jgi:hypothetical protein
MIPRDREIYQEEQLDNIPGSYSAGMISIHRIWTRLINEGFKLRAIYHDHQCTVDLFCLKDGFEVRYTVSLYSITSRICEDMIFNQIVHLRDYRG